MLDTSDAQIKHLLGTTAMQSGNGWPDAAMVEVATACTLAILRLAHALEAQNAETAKLMEVYGEGGGED